MEHFTHDGMTFDVSDSGPTDGEVVVLLHGFPQDRHCWRAVGERLDAHGLRTLAPDQRGYSPGARPAAVSAYAVDRLVGDVIAMLEAAGVERAHVVGHDWGGGVAWALAARHSDRVASLTVLSTPHPAALGAAMVRGQVLRSWYMGVFQLPALPEKLLAWRVRGVLANSGLPRAETDRYAGRFADPASLRGPVNWYRAAARSRWSGLGSDSGVVTVPTTYVWGERDPYLGRAAAVKTSEFVGDDYRFVRAPAGHWLPETEPGLVAEEVLARVRGGVADPVFDRLADAEFVALTTYRRSGEPVSTPMWVAPGGDELVFTTPSDSGKVKRLRRDPSVHVQVCSRMGKVRTGALGAHGRASVAADEAAVARGEAAMRAAYGRQYTGMLRVENLLKRGRRERTVIRVRLD